MSKTILVTGGYGFIGGNFIGLLTRERPDYNIVNVDKCTYAANPDYIADLKDVHSYEVDIVNSKSLDDLFNHYKPNLVVHFAAESHVDNSIKDPSVFVKTNVLGTDNLLSLAVKYGIEKYVQVSTDEVYGSILNGAFTEHSPIDPSSPYSASKAGADHLVQAYHKTFELNTCITRCSNNYGPNQHKEKLIPLMISRALKDEQLPVYGTGLNIRDWIHVEDHCRGILAVLEKGRAGEVYNIGSSNEWTNRDIVKKILKLLDKPESLITYVDDRKGHDYRYAINSLKIHNELGWVPRYSFEQGLTQTIEYYKNL